MGLKYTVFSWHEHEKRSWFGRVIPASWKAYGILPNGVQTYMYTASDRAAAENLVQEAMQRLKDRSSRNYQREQKEVEI